MRVLFGHTHTHSHNHMHAHTQRKRPHLHILMLEYDYYSEMARHRFRFWYLFRGAPFVVRCAQWMTFRPSTIWYSIISWMFFFCYTRACMFVFSFFFVISTMIGSGSSCGQCISTYHKRSSWTRTTCLVLCYPKILRILRMQLAWSRILCLFGRLLSYGARASAVTFFSSFFFAFHLLFAFVYDQFNRNAMNEWAFSNKFIDAN